MSQTPPQTLNRFRSFPNLDDSALGRFRTTFGASRNSLDFDRLVHRDRSNQAPSDAGRSSRASSVSSIDEANDIGRTLTPIDNERHSNRRPELDGNSYTMATYSSCKIVDETYSEAPSLVPDKIQEVEPPIFSHRFVHNADIGPAPFTKPHFISLSRSSPFPGPHTVIEIPFGPDLGNFLHLPHNLSTSEIKFTESAIIWLWSRYREEKGWQEAHTIDIFPSKTGQQLIGPPEAPYPLTDSIFSLLPGPWTYIYNSGNHLTGWILHVPRFLSKHEIAIASLNLRDAATRPFGWGYVHDPDGALAAQRSTDEEAELMEFLTRQGRFMTFLRDVVGLDFASQDNAEDGLTPIWVKRNHRDTEPSTPSEPMMPLTPPSTDTEWSPLNVKQVEVRLQASNAPLRSSASNSIFRVDANLRRIQPTRLLWKIAHESLDVEKDVATPPGFDGTACANNDTIREPRRMKLYTESTQRDNGFAGKDLVNGSQSSISDGGFFEKSDLQDSHLAFLSVQVTQRASEAIDIDQQTFRLNSPHSLLTANPPVHPPTTEADHIPSKSSIDWISIVRQHVSLAFSSFTLSFLLFKVCRNLQGQHVRLAHVSAFLDAVPERRNAIVILTVIVVFTFMPTFCLVLEGQDRLRYLVLFFIVCVWSWFGAIQALDKYFFSPQPMH
jgi:hypothetical protein